MVSKEVYKRYMKSLQGIPMVSIKVEIGQNPEKEGEWLVCISNIGRPSGVTLPSEPFTIHGWRIYSSEYALLWSIKIIERLFNPEIKFIEEYRLHIVSRDVPVSFYVTRVPGGYKREGSQKIYSAETIAEHLRD